MKQIFFFLLLTGQFSFAQTLQTIPLNAGNAYANQQAKDDVNKFFDGDVNTRFTVWSPQFKPYRITFDLSDFDSCSIKQIKYYVSDGGIHNIRYYYVRKDNDQKVLMYSYTGGWWNPNYVTVDIPATSIAKEIILESNGADDFPSELQFLGSFTPHRWPNVTINRSPLSELMGVVVKPWDIANNYWPEKIPVIVNNGIKRIRLYNDYQLNHNNDGSWNMNGGWKQIDNMQLLKSKGITTQMDYLSFPYYPFDTANGARTNTDTYIALAKDIYQFGLSNKQNGEYFKTIEVGNEMNKWYGSNPAIEFMDGYSLATMMSVCYDGHHGKYPECGLKASGSNALVSMSGLATADPDILYEIIKWSIANRGYRADGSVDLPFDVYSYHLYSSLGGQYSGIPGGTAPDVSMPAPMKRINEMRKRYAPWLKIHIGEWSGGDINEHSPLNAPAFGKYSAHQTSAMWTVRALLLMAENEVDASSYYRIKQDYDSIDDGNWGQFATMALERQYNTPGVLDMRRTLTGDYFKQLSEFFNDGWVFDQRLSTSPNVLRFKKAEKYLYAIWQGESMTVTDRPYFTEQFNSFSIANKGTLRRLVDDSSGIMSSTNYIAGTRIDIDAKPVFIIIDNSVVALPVQLLSFNASPIGKKVSLTWSVTNEDLSCYKIERSKNGSNYLEIGLVNAIGKTNYDFTDNLPLTGTNFYRLKLVNRDGTYKYSAVKSVAISAAKIKYTAYNILGQIITEGNDLQQVESQVKQKLYTFQLYIIQGSDGSMRKLLINK